MTKQDLLNKELSNFYALNKQINKYFNGSEIDFLPESVQLGLMDYLRIVCESEEITGAILEKSAVNPTNTIDSIVSEITENLNQIIKQDLDDQVKAAGYRMSVNRLISYQLANFENLKFVGNEKNGISDLWSVAERLRSVKKKIIG